MISKGERRRLFLRNACVAAVPAALLGKCLSAEGQAGRAQRDTREAEAENNNATAVTRHKTVLEENEKDIKKKIAKLFQLASELKDEVEKTDSVKVLSVGMVRKAEEIERLAKDIKSRAKG
jgi:hypothetical protein